MGRRSDHTRSELERLIIDEGHRHMAEVGFARFSTREVARRIGYSIGTLYNVFGSYDRLIFAINTRTFQLWTEGLRAQLDGSPGDRIRILVESYFSFAATNTNVWMAIYDHRVPQDFVVPEADGAIRGELTDIVIREVAAALPEEKRERAPRLARSLIATVHGHCIFALNGSFAAMEEPDPLGMALDRVRESVVAASH